MFLKKLLNFLKGRDKMDNTKQILDRIISSLGKERYFPLYKLVNDTRTFYIHSDILDILKKIPNPQEWNDSLDYKVHILIPQQVPEIIMGFEGEDIHHFESAYVELTLTMCGYRFISFPEYIHWGLNGANLQKLNDLNEQYKNGNPYATS